MSKKGQLTLFVILGILLLLTASLIYTFNKKEITDVKSVIEDTLKKDPLTSYIDSCIKTNTLQGLELQRTQSGYIILPSKQSITINNIEKPYWLTKDKLDFPSINEMENELANYLEQQIKECTNNFNDFKDQGYLIEESNMRVNIEYADQVIVSITYPVTISKENENMK